MRTPELLPRFRVLRLQDGEAVQATWPDWDGLEVYRTGLCPDRALDAACVDAEVLAEGEPDAEAEYVVVNDAGEVLHRVTPGVGVPF